MQLTRLDGVKVLFVDDRRDARFVVHHILKDAGAAVTLSENGLQAVELMNGSASECPFHVVVMDVNMPVLDGLSATRQIRSQGHRLPILALTAGAMKEDQEECLRAGCNGYMRKPIDGIRLVETIHQLAFAERPLQSSAG
jgi:two-component system sensor histidine kinase/response regulator